MDPISLSIIVTVLSLGTVLLYLFKVDFAKNNNQRKQQQQGKHHQSSSVSESSSKKPKNNRPNHQPHSQLAARSAAPNSSPSQTRRPIAAQAPSNNNNIPDLIVGHETTKLQQAVSSPPTASSKTAKKRQEAKQVRWAEVPSGPEFPPLDELDASIAMDLFSASIKQRSMGKRSSSLAEQDEQMGADFESGGRRAGSASPAYSSEQLFTMIAASNLSKDEVELAIEMLLNKMDSGGAATDWKRPRSDPVERLKNQLRDNESWLSVEIQNHEQTRARLVELKSQLQVERQSAGRNEEESTRVRKELGVAELALDQSRAELARLQSAIKQREDDSQKLIARLEQEKMQLQQGLLAKESQARSMGDYEALRAKFDEKLLQLQRYELNQQKMGDRIGELESKLLVSEHLIDELRANKQHDDYEASAKISELKSDRLQLDKALKDQMVRFKEINEANNLLAKTIQELRVINTRQDEMLKQMTDERQIQETSMKRTLQEMELELRELQQKLNANTISTHSARRQEANQTGAAAELETSQKLVSEMNQLRQGLAALFPDASDAKTDDWVQDYLLALKQLSRTLDELNNNHIDESLVGPKSEATTKIDKAATLTPRKNNSSPTSNGRSSRGR